MLPTGFGCCRVKICTRRILIKTQNATNNKGLLRLIFLNNLLHVDIVVPLFIVSLIAKEDMAANF
jgi:hypothetical protein